MKKAFAIALMTLGILCGLPAAAQVYPNQESPKDWHFTMELYGWLPDADGYIEAGEDRVEVNRSISDTITTLRNSLKNGACVHFESGKEKWFFFGDVMQLQLKQGENLTDFRLHVKNNYIVTEGAAGYEVFRSGPTGIQVFGGLRYTYSKSDLDEYYYTSAEPVEINVSGDWFRPFAGARVVYFKDKLAWVLRTDYAAGDGGHQWQIIGKVGYKISKHVMLDAGWRYLDSKLSSSDYTADISNSGPWMGVSWHW